LADALWVSTKLAKRFAVRYFGKPSHEDGYGGTPSILREIAEERSGAG
jgi:hypothetical protein